MRLVFVCAFVFRIRRGKGEGGRSRCYYGMGD